MFLTDHDTKIPWTCEQVGILGKEDYASWTNRLKKDYFCDFNSTDDVKAFHCWILNYRPNLVVMEYSLIQSISVDELEDLQATLDHWGINSLLICDNLDQIHQLRGEKWPRAHFMCRPIEEGDFQDRVVRILMERYLASQPLIAVMTQNQFLLDSLRSFMGRYGFHVDQIEKSNVAGLRCKLVCEEPLAVLCDVSERHLLPKTLRENPGQTLLSQVPLFWVSDSKIEIKDISGKIFDPTQFSTLVEKCVAGTQDKTRLQIMRDPHTGLVIKSIFMEVALEQMSLVSKRADEMSLIRFHLDDLLHHDKYFGNIFSTILMSNLALFIKNRVRSTDFVGMGDHGEVWVMLPRCGSYAANIVSQRIVTQFREAAAFGEEEGGFRPCLTTQSYTFPYDFNSSHELLSLFGNNGMQNSLPALLHPDIVTT